MEKGFGNVDSSMPVEEVMQHPSWRNFTGSCSGRDKDHCSRCGNRNTFGALIDLSFDIWSWRSDSELDHALELEEW
ncbi:unnamed protein product [Calypogeia fissa]